jgi:iron complex outermembrane receptor protein
MELTVMNQKFPQLFLPMLSSVFLLLIMPCQAAENGGNEDPFFQELPIVLTASRLSQPQSESPSEITVIDREMIKASGFRTVPDLMRLVPGMYVGYVDGNTPVLSLHNSTDQFSRQMQVLVDGRSVYMPPLGGVNWADLPILIDDIERVEVVRGPSTASHGANSFYGVINIITREASGLDGGRISVAGGDASDASIRLNHSRELFDFRLSAGYRSDEGYNNQYLNDHNKTRIANFRGNFHPNGSDSFDFQLGSSSGIYGQGIMQTHRDKPTDAIYFVRTDNWYRDTTANNEFQQLTWSHTWSANDESKLSYSHTTNSTVDPMLCVTGDCKTSSELVRSVTNGQRDVLEMQNTNQLGEHNRLVWGGSTDDSYAENPLLLASVRSVSSWQVFAHEEWRITPKAVLNVGSMFEDNGIGSQNSSPRASFNYHLTPRDTVRIGVSTATRSPTIMEAYINANNKLFGGQYVPPVTPLRPEKILSREIAYLGEFPSLNMTLDTRAYIDQVNDMILVDKCVDGVDACNQDSWKNLGYAEFKGLDTTLKYYWDEKHSFLSANYAYQRATLNLSATPTEYYSSVANSDYGTLGAALQAFYNSQYIALFPQTVQSNSGSLLLSQRIAESWQFSAGYYFRAPIRVLDVSPDVTRESRMRRLDVRLAKNFKLEKGGSVEVAAIAQNITQDAFTKYDTLNAEVNVMFTQRGWLTMTLKF